MTLQLLLRHGRAANVILSRPFCSARVDSKLIDNIKKYYQKVSSSHSSVAEKTEAVNLRSLMCSLDSLCSDLKSLDEEINNAKNDKELVNLMSAEYVDIATKQGELIEEILDEILALDQQQSSNELDSYTKSSKMLFEISPGVGGKEAMLFANDISSLYTKYFAAKRWTVSDLDVDENNGYLRHFHAAVQGYGIWDHLRFEAGVHRVQRIPATEVSPMMMMMMLFALSSFLTRDFSLCLSAVCPFVTDSWENSYIDRVCRLYSDRRWLRNRNQW